MSFAEVCSDHWGLSPTSALKGTFLALVTLCSSVSVAQQVHMKGKKEGSLEAREWGGERKAGERASASPTGLRATEGGITLFSFLCAQPPIHGLAYSWGSEWGLEGPHSRTASLTEPHGGDGGGEVESHSRVGIQCPPLWMTLKRQRQMVMVETEAPAHILVKKPAPDGHAGREKPWPLTLGCPSTWWRLTD